MVTNNSSIQFKFIISALITWLLFFSSASYAVNITVRTSQNPVALDDTFHLVYEADSSVDGDPNFDPLTKNFDILNSSQSTNMRLINGNYSLKKTWDLVLSAKDIGKFTLPSIAFGKDRSPSILITVKNSVTPNSTLPNGQASIPAKIFLEASVDNKSAYIQGQIIYSIRLLRTVGITSASLSEPTTSDPDAIIQKLGEDNNYQTTRHGTRYDVIERRYVIYPQHSGQLRIKPVTFEGRVSLTQPRTIFDQFNMIGQLKRLRSRAVTIKIKPRPVNIKASNWLPASQLKLVDDWSANIKQLKTGEPVTRTVTIIAQGQMGSLLPDIKFADINHLKQYPDKAITTDKPGNDGMTGARQIKVALIPARPGDYVLPAIKLPWWNTRTNKAEIATLPPVTLHVSGTATLPAQSQPPAQSVNTPTPVSAHTPAITAVKSMAENSSFWQWVSLALATGWLLTLIYLFVSRTRATPVRRKIKPETPASGPLEKAVFKACKNSQPETIKNALLSWAQRRWPEKHITSLTQLAQQCPANLRDEIEKLNTILYKPTQRSPGFDSKALAKAFKQCKTRRGKSTQKNETVLEPLYKGS